MCTGLAVMQLDDAILDSRGAGSIPDGEETFEQSIESLPTQLHEDFRQLQISANSPVYKAISTGYISLRNWMYGHLPKSSD